MAEFNSVSMGDPQRNRERLGTLVNTEAQVEAAVRCSIILPAGNDSSRLNAYLLSLSEAKLPGDYKLVIINDRGLEIEERRLKASLPALKVLNTGRPLSREQLFDKGAVAAGGKYLLFIRNLINFDSALLEEAIRNLETSGEKVSISANKIFVLVERFHYASVGGFAGLFRSASGMAHEAGSLSKEELADREWEYKYSLLREPKVKSWVTGDRNEQIELELKRNNFSVVDLVIETGDYWKYIEAAELYKLKRNYGGYDGPGFPEKSLEHYLAAKLLQLGPDDVYIDVASQHSPAVQIYHKLYGCKTYRQDMSYPAGISGDMIGGDAGAMPVPDGFATKMGLHCSFEHFEGDSDIRFIREAGRVLQPGGKVCILPLYLSCRYAIQTDPAVLPESGIEFEPDAVLYCARGYRSRHGRFYDVPHFISRVKDNLNGLQLTIYSVRNAQEVHPSCYVRFIAILEKRRDTVN